MEYWSIEKIISGCEVFHKPSLYNVSIRDEIVLLPLHHSITPILHKPFKFQETKSPLGITKAGSFGPGFLRYINIIAWPDPEFTDITWLQDDSVRRGEDLPEPSDIADEILAQLSIAKEEMQKLARLLVETN